jgi:hypothetical protein
MAADASPPARICGFVRATVRIIMIDSAGRDKDTVSSLSGGENFSARWLRSN